MQDHLGGLVCLPQITEPLLDLEAILERQDEHWPEGSLVARDVDEPISSEPLYGPAEHVGIFTVLPEGIQLLRLLD